MVRIKHLLGLLLVLLLPATIVFASSQSCFDGSNRHFTRRAVDASPSAAEAEGEGKFQFCQEINDNLFLYYTPDFNGSDKVLIGLHAVKDTFGWTALAIGGNGGMKGASQIVVRKINDNSDREEETDSDESNSAYWVVEDRNSQDYKTPSLDESQDLELVFAEQSDDGETAWGVLLPMYSCDDFDYVIHNVSRPLHWAVGEDHIFSYHGHRRGQFRANLRQAPKSTETLVRLATTTGESTVMDLIMPNVSASPADGHRDPVNPYVCTYFDLEQLYKEGGGDPQYNYKDKLHLIRFESVLPEETKQYVHHSVLFSCSEESFGELHHLQNVHHRQVINNCNGMRVGCLVPVLGWTQGMSAHDFPGNVGMPIGEGNRWLVLQVHYYNPGLEDAIYDSSGIRAHIARELRTHDAGIFSVLGAISQVQQLDPLPGGEKVYAMPSFVVPSGCTYTLWEEPINVRSVLHHQHMFGTHVELEARRYGQSLGTLRDEKHFDFIHQSFDPPLISQLLPGDELILRCQYDTSSLSTNDSVAIGLGTDEEMCFVSIMYWPRQKWANVISINPDIIIDRCQNPGSGHLFENASRCAQDLFEDPARFLNLQWDYKEHFDAQFMCNSAIFEEDMIPRGLDLCPSCYMNKNCTVEEVAAYGQEFCKDFCSLKANTSLYPDVSKADGFNMGIQGCAGPIGKPRDNDDLRFFNAPHGLEAPMSFCEELPTKVDSTITNALESNGDAVPTWKVVIFTVFGLMTTAVVLFICFHLVFGSKNQHNPSSGVFSSKWTGIIQSFGGWITSFLCWIARQAAMHPRAYVAATIILSMGILLLGLATNFTVETQATRIWMPAGSKSDQHWKFIERTYQDMPRPFSITVHKQGSNVVSHEGVFRVFEALDVVRDSQGFSEVCESTSRGCKIHGVTNFWNHSLSLFELQITSDEDSQAAMSENTFPDGSPVDIRGLLGYPQWNGNGTQLTGALSYTVRVELPPETTSEASGPSLVYDFEKVAIENALHLRHQWEQESGNAFRLEVWATSTLDDEVQRALTTDMALIPIGFCIMVTFVCLVFSKNDVSKSQSLLGLGAVVSVELAMISGFGLLFVAGVPLTSSSLLLSFIILGIGLDDAFIIFCAFKRTNQDLEAVERIDLTIRDVGLTIAATTVTSVLAFCLGTLSNIPAVDWLCYYAIPTLITDFFYQITFFVALIVIDEKRIMSARRDCCVCFSVSAAKANQDSDNEEQELQAEEDSENAPWSERIMGWYAARLVQGWIKGLILVGFAALFVSLAYSASLLTQDFNIEDYLPSDSYLLGFSTASKLYSSRYAMGAPQSPHLYFKGVDQSKEDVQRQMEDYVNDMVNNMDAIQYQPPFFWLRHFRQYDAVQFGTSFEILTFQEKLNKFLEEPVFRELYSDSGDIVLDEDGNIVSSRVLLFMSPHEEDIHVPYLINLLEAQRSVSSSQPINRNKDDWSFFAYHEAFYTWEFYSRIFDELLFTSALCVIGVTATSMFFLPHWTGAFFIFPVIAALYIDLLGFLQLVGVTMNPTSFIAVIIGIGLMVDYNIHILLRYYECKGSRNERVKETLRTMGSSVVLGAVTTFFGTVPLIFGVTEISKILFYSFNGLVVLGVLHGLVLLPVLLSFLGPEGEAEHDCDDPPALLLNAPNLAQAKNTDMGRLGTDESEPGHVSLTESQSEWSC